MKSRAREKVASRRRCAAFYSGPPIARDDRSIRGQPSEIRYNFVFALSRAHDCATKATFFMIRLCNGIPEVYKVV